MIGWINKPIYGHTKNPLYITWMRRALGLSIVALLITALASPSYGLLPSTPIQYAAWVTSLALCFLLCLDGGHRIHKGLYFIAATVFCWGVGETLIVFRLPVVNGVFDPLLANILLLVPTPLALIGIFMLIKTWATKIPLAVVLNGTIIGLAGAALAVTIFTPLALDENIKHSDLTFALLSPVADILIIGFWSSLFTILRARDNPLMILGFMGMALFAVADTSTIFFLHNGTLYHTFSQQVVWVGAFALFTLGAGSRQMEPTSKWKLNPSAMTLPVVAVITSLGILLFADRTFGSLALAGLTIIAGMLRTVFVFLEVRKLHEENTAILAKVEHQSVMDALTGLYNRRGFQNELEKALASNKPLSMLMFDLDRFKEVNDTLGHDYGDELLIGVAQRMREMETATVIPARLGGDEFAMIVTDMDIAEHVSDLAWRIHSHIVRPLAVSNTPLSVEVSIGIAEVDEDRSESLLLKRADVAMYHAKRGGRGVYRWNSELSTGSVKKLRLTSQLREAIEQGQLFLHYQPKLSVQGENLDGVEALVRWKHPIHGIIPPDDFIPAAESTALIHPLTSFVLDNAIAQGAEWLNTGKAISVSVNLSPRSLLEEGIVDEISQLLIKHGLPAHLLDIEITETAIMEDVERAKETLTLLHELGVTLSLDDFGAGYTSLSQITNLPLDIIKVDRSLVSRVVSGTKRGSLLKNIVNLASDLNLKVVAEGVEDRDTLDLLSSANCSSAQGYLFSPPVTAHALNDWMDRKYNKEKTTDVLQGNKSK